MHNASVISQKELNRIDREVTIPAFVLCTIIALVLGITPMVPSAITKILKPIMIGICFLIPGKYAYKANKTITFFAIYLFYMTLVFLSHDITSATFNGWMSAILFGVFFIVVSQRMWGTKEILFIFITAFFASLLYTALLHHYNHDLYHASEALMFHGEEINANAAVYTICPGALCGVVLFLYDNKKEKYYAAKKTVILVGVLLCFYTLICLGQRGAFFSFSIGSVLMIWEKCGANSRSKTQYRMLLVIIIAIGLIAAPRITEGSRAERLFDYEELFDDNGRDDLNDRAKEMINEKPFFGGGYDRWERESGKELGLHNGFLYIMVIGGYTAGFLIGFFFLSMFAETTRKKSLIPIAFVIAAGIHLFEDSGLDYFSYIPMILSYILIRNAEFRAYRVTDVFAA